MRIKGSSMQLITTVVCVLPIILSLTLYQQLPPQIAVHWDVAGKPDNYMSKAVVAFVFPLCLAALNIIVHIVINNDPKKMNVAPVLRKLGLWIIPVLSLILMPITLFKALGADLPIQTIAPSFVGMLLIVIGNYLPKSKQSYTVGVKLPWTLASQENWNRTHRAAGYLWILGGILMILTSFLNVFVEVAIVAIIVLIVVAPAVYSFSLYKKGV